MYVPGLRNPLYSYLGKHMHSDEWFVNILHPVSTAHEHLNYLCQPEAIPMKCSPQDSIQTRTQYLLRQKCNHLVVTKFSQHFHAKQNTFPSQRFYTIWNIIFDSKAQSSHLESHTVVHKWVKKYIPWPVYTCIYRYILFVKSYTCIY